MQRNSVNATDLQNFMPLSAFVRESTGHQWIPLTNNIKLLCFSVLMLLL